MNIEKLLDDLMNREGGYVDHPSDRGGPTSWGITQDVAHAHGYKGTMRDFSRQTARNIYRARYWTAPGFDKVADIAPRVSAELFDTGVNMGPSVAIGFLQRALNALNRNARDYRDVPVDRVIGTQTQEALRRFLHVRGSSGEDVLVKALNALQGERYIALAEQRPPNEAFAYGWIANRLS
jgi:lysozyme family protein